MWGEPELARCHCSLRMRYRRMSCVRVCPSSATSRFSEAWLVSALPMSLWPLTLSRRLALNLCSFSYDSAAKSLHRNLRLSLFMSVTLPFSISRLLCSVSMLASGRSSSAVAILAQSLALVVVVGLHFRIEVQARDRS